MSKSKLGVWVVMAATATISLWPLFWTVREGLQPLSTNSEFFAYSWIYGVRWGAGDGSFVPHSQLIYPIYATINWIFGLTSGAPLDVIAGWRRVALIWPMVLMLGSLAFIFATISRSRPLTDTVVSSALFLLSVPLYLTAYAVESLAYHTIAITLAMASLPLWNFYKPGRQAPPVIFYIAVGIYAATCTLAKPTFIAFALPFYAMEFVRSIVMRRFGGLLISAFTALIAFNAYLFAFYGNASEFKAHFSQTYNFMRGQADWYDAEKRATPFHWYFGYVVGKMGPLPSLLVLTSIFAAALNPQRLLISVGILTAILCGLFILYSRSQVHAHPEFIGLLVALAIASARCSGVLADWTHRRLGAMAIIAPITTLLLLWLMNPPDQAERGFTRFMAKYDDIALPAIFGNPGSKGTVVVEDYPNVIWGVVDAWCRGSANIFNAGHSRLLDRSLGNVTCLVNRDDPAIDLSGFDRAMFVWETKSLLSETITRVSKFFPAVMARFSKCEPYGNPTSGLQMVECRM
jgi:hypothetical protein